MTPRRWSPRSEIRGCAGSLVAAFLTDADIAARKKLRETAAWREEAAKTRLTHLRFGTMEGEPRIASATSSRLAAVAGPSRLAVGDAALSFDPLSSLGIDTALSCAVAAARAIDAHLRDDANAILQYAHGVTKIWKDFVRPRALLRSGAALAAFTFLAAPARTGPAAVRHAARDMDKETSAAMLR